MPGIVQATVQGLSLDHAADFAGKKVHLIGAGGCGMSGVAAMLMRHGATVSGSDQAESHILQHLSNAGATIYIGHDHHNLPADVDLVVASAAIPDGNPELLAARAQGKHILKYAELLGELMQCTTGVAIAGTHGKSSTTAMTAFVAREAGLRPSFIIGAEVPQLGGGSGVGSGDAFIVEACEYDRSFLHLAPTHAAILNIEEDHLDYYADLAQIVEAFAEFAALLPPHGTLIYHHDDNACRQAAAAAKCRTESIGRCAGATWQASDITFEDGLPSFKISYRDQALGHVRLAIPGEHHIDNALAAGALAHHVGADSRAILAAVERFHGALRRLTFRGRYRGVDILDDYAHHPTEIISTLKAVRQRYQPKRLRVVFQPHQVSRTRFFLNDFARSFALADEVLVPDIYFVRDSEADRQLVSSHILVERIRQCGGTAQYIPSLTGIADHLAGVVCEHDALLTMGAGDVWKVADDMVSRLRVRG